MEKADLQFEMENDTFVLDLQKEIKNAEGDFADAKASAIKDLDGMTIHMATDFGAAYATHIDRVTRFASKIKTLYEVLNGYKYRKGYLV